MATLENKPEIIHPPLPPGPLKWVKENLFSGFLNTVLTLVIFPVLSYVLFMVIKWVFFGADWRAVTQFPMLYTVMLKLSEYSSTATSP